MTISTTTNRVAYTGNGATVDFSFPYAFFAQADLVVVETIIATGVQTVKTITTHYTISGSVDALGHYSSGGTVTAVTAPATTVTWTIYRDPTATQTTDLVENDPMPAESLEAALDYQTMLNQRTRDIAARSLQQPEGDSATIDRLPAKVDRASKYLAFDADGDPVATAGTTSVIVTTPYIETVLDDTTLAAAKTTLQVGDAAPSVRNLRGVTASATQYTLFLTHYVNLLNATTKGAVLRVAPGSLTVDVSVAGPAVNGRDQAGAFANPSWLHIYYIWDGVTIGLVASTTAPPTGPTLPAGYTHWGYATTVYFTTSLPDQYTVGGTVYAAMSGYTGLTSASYVTMGSLSALVPPIATHALGLCRILGTSTGGGALDASLSVVGKTGLPIVTVAEARLYLTGINTTAQVTGYTPFVCPLITAQTVYYKLTATAGSSISAEMQITGYRVPNGED